MIHGQWEKKTVEFDIFSIHALTTMRCAWVSNDKGKLLHKNFAKQYFELKISQFFAFFSLEKNPKLIGEKKFCVKVNAKIYDIYNSLCRASFFIFK